MTLFMKPLHSYLASNSIKIFMIYQFEIYIYNIPPSQTQPIHELLYSIQSIILTELYSFFLPPPPNEISNLVNLT